MGVCDSMQQYFLSLWDYLIVSLTILVNYFLAVVCSCDCFHIRAVQRSFHIIRLNSQGGQ